MNENERMNEDERMNRIRELPTGYISVKKIKGKSYPYYQWREGGKVRSRYVKADELEALTQQIEERRRLQDAVGQHRMTARLEEYRRRLMQGRIAIGIQDYDELIEKKLFYVDKTQFLEEWWQNQDKVTLITRPRRFGKTLTMSMTKCFFSVDYAGRSDLFEHMRIWNSGEMRGLQGAYPVLSLSFAGIKASDYEDIRVSIGLLMQDLWFQNQRVPEEECFTEEDRSRYREMLRALQAGNVTEMAAFLRYLSEILYRYYGKKVIILLDEYDTPLQEAYLSPSWEKSVRLLRELFNMTFKSNPWLERAILTGITRISRESFFSDMNHLKVCGMSDRDYSDCFGLLEEEVFDAMEEQRLGQEENRQKVKAAYDGFIIGDREDIYNPWSVINYLREREIRPYWVNSGSNQLISRLIAGSEIPVRKELETLVQGGTIRAAVREEIRFDQLDQDADAVWSLLYASGYVKRCSGRENLAVSEMQSVGARDAVGKRSREDWPVCEIKPQEQESGMLGKGAADISAAGSFWDDSRDMELQLTNREVVGMMKRMILDWFRPVRGICNDFVHALMENRVSEMTYSMNRMTMTMFSVFDSGKKPSAFTMPERFYHGFVLGLLVELEGRYEIRSNRESGLGRYDVMMIPRNPADPACILEFKVRDPAAEISLQRTAKEALRQIRERAYDAELKDRGIAEAQIRRYGFAFEGKQVLIEGE